ncbi:MAG: Smr/MutS family protein [Rheinheimera sp.]|nr:Smr/MutS family protein [Rheinheimera sp.]
MLLGKTLVEARSALGNFINDCHTRGIRTLLIHHGMGRDSKPHPAILKSYTFKWLMQLPEVLACPYCAKESWWLCGNMRLLSKNAEQKRENRERHQKK